MSMFFLIVIIELEPLDFSLYLGYNSILEGPNYCLLSDILTPVHDP